MIILNDISLKAAHYWVTQSQLNHTFMKWGVPLNLQMSVTRILIKLLCVYIPRNWEFGPAFPKLRNFRGGGGGRGLTPPPGYASARSEASRYDWCWPACVGSDTANHRCNGGCQSVRACPCGHTQQQRKVSVVGFLMTVWCRVCCYWCLELADWPLDVRLLVLHWCCAEIIFSFNTTLLLLVLHNVSCVGLWCWQS
jgi:hypothetical protein